MKNIITKKYEEKVNDLSKYIEINNENKDKYLKKIINYFYSVDLYNNSINYCKDNRSVEDYLINVVVNGWMIEDHIIEQFINNNIKVEKNGSDRNRTFTSNINLEADIKVNNKKVEIQVLGNENGDLRIKTNKINSLIKNNINLLVFNKYDKNYIMINTTFLKKIKNEYKEQEIYLNKFGYIINKKVLNKVDFKTILNFLGV